MTQIHLSQHAHDCAKEIEKHTQIQKVPAGYAFRVPTLFNKFDETSLYIGNIDGRETLQDDGLLWADLEGIHFVSGSPQDNTTISKIMETNGITWEEKYRIFMMPLPENPEDSILFVTTFQTAIRAIRTIAKNRETPFFWTKGTPPETQREAWLEIAMEPDPNEICTSTGCSKTTIGIQQDKIWHYAEGPDLSLLGEPIGSRGILKWAPFKRPAPHA